MLSDGDIWGGVMMIVTDGCGCDDDSDRDGGCCDDSDRWCWF